MTPPNPLQTLINQLCPNGVEFKELGEIAQILNGYAFQSSKYTEKGIRVIRISDVQKGKMSDKDLKFYPLETKEEIERYLLKNNDLVMSLTGNVGRVAMLSESDLPAGLNQRVACIRSKSNDLLTRFLFHFFDQDSFETEAMANATGGGQKNLSTTWLSKFKIPLPPLAVQQEIVRILDSFTELKAELEAELEARKKQYEFYRDELLSPKIPLLRGGTVGDGVDYFTTKYDFGSDGVESNTAPKSTSPSLQSGTPQEENIRVEEKEILFVIDEQKSLEIPLLRGGTVGDGVDYFTTKYDFGSDGVESNTAPKSTSPSLQSGTPQRGELGLVEYEWKTLGEVGEFKYGFTDKALDEGNTRFVRITDINGNGKLIAEDSKYINLNEANKDYLLQKGDVLMARTGATFGKTMLFNEDYSSIYASFLIRLRFERSLILPNFYWHFAQSNLYWEQANKLVGGGAQPQFNANVLKLVKIPIPPLLEQERIVSILDKFDALVNDISIGLPAELKARRKQYEYYRNQLLSFREYASK